MDVEEYQVVLDGRWQVAGGGCRGVPGSVGWQVAGGGGRGVPGSVGW